MRDKMLRSVKRGNRIAQSSTKTIEDREKAGWRKKQKTNATNESNYKSCRNK